jgi:hypothetical protein
MSSAVAIHSGAGRSCLTPLVGPQIFAERALGSGRQYGTAVAVDVSLSMHGQRAAATMEALALLLGGLAAVPGGDAVGLLTFGEAVRLVRPPGEPWDGAAVLALLSQVRRRGAWSVAAVDASLPRTALSNLRSMLTMLHAS